MTDDRPSDKTSAIPIQNRILSSLRRSDHTDFLALLEVVELKRGAILQTAGTVPEFAYFLNGGIVSFTVLMPAGDHAEFGVVGREGVSSYSVFFEDQVSPVETMVQVGDASAYRVPAVDLRREMTRSDDLRSLIFRHLYEFMSQMAYTAISNARHTLPQRLARWLLLCNDRLTGNEIPLTHEFMAMMLGSQRTSVTTTLHILEGEGAIYSRRGVVVMRSRGRLEACAGEAYSLIGRQTN